VAPPEPLSLHNDATAHSFHDLDFWAPELTDMVGECLPSILGDTPVVSRETVPRVRDPAPDVPTQSETHMTGADSSGETQITSMQQPAIHVKQKTKRAERNNATSKRSKTVGVSFPTTPGAHTAKKVSLASQPMFHLLACKHSGKGMESLSLRSACSGCLSRSCEG